MLVLLVLSTGGCGSFVAHRMAQAPNTYPTWFAPKARVSLGFSPGFLTNFPAHFVEVGPPAAKLRYRVVEPADYELKSSSTNWLKHGQPHYDFTFHANVPGQTNAWTGAPRGTVVLLHGYGISMFAMAPWALRLAQDGWRCVLVDLRGHGKSTGRRLYFGLQETYDLTQLLDRLAQDGELKQPVAVVGESYGAALALRWEGVEPRVRKVVAIAPYAVLSNAVLNISHDYVAWMPKSFIRAGLNKLPSVLEIQPGELDSTTVLRRNPVAALFVAGAEDKVAPAAEVDQLRALAAPGSEFIAVPHASHEAVTYFFDELAAPVSAWLNGESSRQQQARGH
ncbi:MAG: alpha/beta hydrolase [Pedosphaera sp.]|nr:alpha/beta hydrolase [Pedosphaera sp.]